MLDTKIIYDSEFMFVRHGTAVRRSVSSYQEHCHRCNENRYRAAETSGCWCLRHGQQGRILSDFETTHAALGDEHVSLRRNIASPTFQCICASNV